MWIRPQTVHPEVQNFCNVFLELRPLPWLRYVYRGGRWHTLTKKCQSLLEGLPPLATIPAQVQQYVPLQASMNCQIWPSGCANFSFDKLPSTEYPGSFCESCPNVSKLLS